MGRRLKIPAKGASCGTGTIQAVRKKLKERGKSPKRLYKAKVAGKSGYCSDVKSPKKKKTSAKKRKR